MKAPSKNKYAIVSLQDSHAEGRHLPVSTAILGVEASSKTSSAVDIQVLDVDQSWTKGEVQSPAYRDKKFAIAFIVHLLLICIAAPFAPSAIRNIVIDSQQIDPLQNTRKRSNERFLTRIFMPSKPLHVHAERRVDVEDVNQAALNFDNVALSKENKEGRSNPNALEENRSQPVSFNERDATSKKIRKEEEYFDPEEVEKVVKAAINFCIFVVVASLALSVTLALGALYLLREQAQNVIKGSLFFIIGYFILEGVLSLLIPSSSLDGLDEEAQEMMQEAPALVNFILALIFACYTKAVWRDIPFAAINLKVGVSACRANLGVFVFAFLTPVINTIVFVLQLMALVSVLQASGTFSQDQTDIGSAASSIAIIYFMISGYWTSEVTKNISTVLVSGTVGTWWFAPLEASSFCSSAVVDSFKRATTYSFGSICFGSLLVAILNVIIDSVKRSRRSRSCALLSCVLTCLLSLLERLVEYFNKWAFVYVGLYGYDYMTAGKNVVTLFRARGWSSIITDNLVNRALMMVATFIGLITGLIIAGTWNLFEISNAKDESVEIISFMFFYVASIIGLVNANQLLSVVGAATDASIVCFAEASAEFEENHPELSAMMLAAYSAAWPETSFHREVV
jgi:hypothetical protein